MGCPERVHMENYRINVPLNQQPISLIRAPVEGVVLPDKTSDESQSIEG